jgi:hypothetical protein
LWALGIIIRVASHRVGFEKDFSGIGLIIAHISIVGRRIGHFFPITGISKMIIACLNKRNVS